MEINKNKVRASVSAEAFGDNNKSEFQPKVVEKDDTTKERINKIMSKAFMFSNLSTEDKKMVVDAMEKREFNEGDNVIKQGDEGSELFLVDTGTLSCYKKFNPDEDDKFLKDYHEGEIFGELALLYNAPRAATISCKTSSVCWALDRSTFTHVLRVSNKNRQEKFEKFLQNVDLLKEMDQNEKLRLCDAMNLKDVAAGEDVIKENENGDTF